MEFKLLQRTKGCGRFFQGRPPRKVMKVSELSLANIKLT